jgi:hypothetical protein
MPRTILGVHGLGDHRDGAWVGEWQSAMAAWAGWSADFAFEPYTYDPFFETLDLSAADNIKAVGKLLGSGFDSWLRRRNRRQEEGIIRDTFDRARNYLHWYPGYVVAWAERPDFRDTVITDFLAKVKAVEPTAIFGHSLGSLVTYSALRATDRHDAKLREIFAKATYVTFGSQIANPFVVKWLTDGQVERPGVKRWFHLYNEHDYVFTAPIRLPGDESFFPVETPFTDKPHNGPNYLASPGTTNWVWPTIRDDGARETPRRRLESMARPIIMARPVAKPEPKRKALLVGLNEYPDPAQRLAGCVNDVFLMSAILQENGFSEDHIRVVLDRRATAAGILERMHWLLDDAQPDDELVFFYSGHGAQLPTYGDGDIVDRMDETLVPYDFDWSEERCITDDTIFGLYGQLPYKTRLTMIFDCCHSGGIHRDGSPRARGLTPPDDIRHRAMKWDAARQMWMPRTFDPTNATFAKSRETAAAFAGENGAVRKLGRAMALRRMDEAEYEVAKAKAKGPVGPYLPVILEACREDQLAYEYRHGAESYGAFTFSLVQSIRAEKPKGLKKMIADIGDRLGDLGYAQEPQLLGPSKLVAAKPSFLKPAA